MHLVTSSLFLPSIASLLPPASQERLLRAYLATVLAWYISRGMPKLDIRGFLEAPLEAVPGETAGRGEERHTLRTLSSSRWSGPSETEVRQPNLMWHALLRTASLHQDVHLTKIIRALSHWGALLGGKGMRVAVRSRRVSEPPSLPLPIHMQSRMSRLSGSGSAGFSHLSRPTHGDGYDVLVPLDFNGRDVSGGQGAASVRRKASTVPSQWNPVEREFDFEERTGCADHMLGDYNQYASTIWDPSGTPRSTSQEPYEELRIDGSLFLRVALLTSRRLGWAGLSDSVEMKRGWDFGPFEIRDGKEKRARTVNGGGSDRLISKL